MHEIKVLLQKLAGVQCSTQVSQLHQKILSISQENKRLGLFKSYFAPSKNIHYFTPCKSKYFFSHSSLGILAHLLSELLQTPTQPSTFYSPDLTLWKWPDSSPSDAATWTTSMSLLYFPVTKWALSFWLEKLSECITSLRMEVWLERKRTTLSQN